MSSETQFTRLVMVISLSLGLSPTLMLAQQPGSVQRRSIHPLQPSDTSSPTATLNSLIESCNELQRLIGLGPITEELAAVILPTTERILDCLDLSELPKELRSTAGINSALFLKEALDRTTLPPDEEIPEMKSEGSDQPLRRWRIPLTRFVIARPEQGPQQANYLFTPETVRRAAEFYLLVKQLPYRTDGRAVSPGLYVAYVAATRKTPTQSTDTSSPRGTLTLFLDTPIEKVSRAIEITRSTLDNHEGMDPDFPPRVYFTDFNPDSFNIRFSHWFTPPNLWQHYAFCEEVNLEICRAFEEQGIQFSLPTRHSYWKHDDQQGPLEIVLDRNTEDPDL